MDKRRPEEGRVPSSLIPTVITPELVDTDDNDLPDADASGDSDDETEDENEAGRGSKP